MKMYVDEKQRIMEVPEREEDTIFMVQYYDPKYGYVDVTYFRTWEQATIYASEKRDDGCSRIFIIEQTTTITRKKTRFTDKDYVE